jgi:UPF0042 nucleotide-binding protein
VINDLTLIGGVSGSGKSVALTALEDSGYYTVSHLPLPLILPTARLLTATGERALAITLNSKMLSDTSELDTTLASLKEEGWNARLLFLDAKNDTLVKRFSETRRRHPFSDTKHVLVEAIEKERLLVDGLRARSFVIDTSDLSASALRGWIKDFAHIDASRLLLMFESFGYKHGVPFDADLVFDARCLPNPYYETGLAVLTGRDNAVVEFLEASSEVERMRRDICDFVSRWLPEYERDNRNYLTVAIGCTGGRHRSVYLAEQLAAVFQSKYQVIVRHRVLTPPISKSD